MFVLTEDDAGTQLPRGCTVYLAWRQEQNSTARMFGDTFRVIMAGIRDNSTLLLPSWGLLD